MLTVREDSMMLDLVVRKDLTDHHRTVEWATGSSQGKCPRATAMKVLKRETSVGQTLAAVGSTRAVLLLLQFSKPGAHGLAADLATGGPTGPPGI